MFADWRVVGLGGDADDGASAGAFYVFAYSAASNNNVNIGSQLALKRLEHHRDSQYVTIQFKIDDAKYILFNGSRVLADQLEKYKDNLPFYTVIKKIDKYYTFT